MLDDTGVKDVFASVLQGELIKCRYRCFWDSNILTGIFRSSVPGLTTVRFLDSMPQDRESLILQTVLVDSWGQCKDADVLLESPSAMAGVHIAEALRMLLPYAICVSRTLNFLQTSHTSGPLPCPGQSMCPHYEWSIREPDIWTVGLASSLTPSWVRRSSRPHLTLRRAFVL
jgi:hypothetical protein